jgi:hypothetical protein
MGLQVKLGWMGCPPTPVKHVLPIVKVPFLFSSKMQAYTRTRMKRTRKATPKP